MTKVLIVDDATANRKALAALLAQAGYAASAAANADEARRIFAEERPDFVLTDRQMPGEDGIALAHALRASEAGRHARIALLSGDAEEPAAEDGLFDAVLSKPVTLEDLRGFLEGARP